MKIVVMVVSCVVLAACDVKPATQESKQQRATRAANVAAAINKPLSPRVLQAGAHELVVLDVPSAQGRTLVERQRCYVWRDAEFKTATISCPGGETSLDLGREYSGPDSFADGAPVR